MTGATARAVVLWLGFALVAALVLSHSLDRWDIAGLAVWRQAANPAALRGPAWMATLATAITTLGAPAIRNTIALIAAAILLRLRAPRQAGALVITIAAAWIASDLLKLWFARIRPDAVPHLVFATGYSFPSGHSMNAAAVYIALAFAAAPWIERPEARQALMACAVVLSALVALSRVWLGVHYPTDTIAGWLAGAGCAVLASPALRGRPSH